MFLREVLALHQKAIVNIVNILTNASPFPRYHPSEESDQVRRESEGSASGRSGAGQYLHPSLSAGIQPNLTPGTPTTTPAHKPTPDCSYSKLIHKIKEQQKNSAVVEGITGMGDISAPGSPAPATSTPATSTPAASTPATTPAQETPTSNSITKKAKVKSNSTPVGSPKVGLVDYPSFNQTKDSEVDSDADMNGSEGDKDDDEEDCLETKEEETTEYSRIKWPPPDVQMVIDKMASYIIKNGAEFEAMVRSRGIKLSFLLNTLNAFCVYCLDFYEALIFLSCMNNNLLNVLDIVFAFFHNFTPTLLYLKSYLSCR